MIEESEVEEVAKAIQAAMVEWQNKYPSTPENPAAPLARAAITKIRELDAARNKELEASMREAFS